MDSGGTPSSWAAARVTFGACSLAALDLAAEDCDGAVFGDVNACVEVGGRRAGEAAAAATATPAGRRRGVCGVEHGGDENAGTEHLEKVAAGGLKVVDEVIGLSACRQVFELLFRGVGFGDHGSLVGGMVDFITPKNSNRHCAFDGGENLGIAAAAADVLVHPREDIFIRRFGFGFQQGRGGDDHAGDAVAALVGPFIAKGLLDRMQGIAGGEALDGGDGLVGESSYRSDVQE